jgi:hypothetical protein
MELCKNQCAEAVVLLRCGHAGFWMQQANFILPWRWVVVLQLVNFAASLRWSTQIPCLLHLQLDSSGQLPFQDAAVQACERLQQIFLIIGWMLGDPFYLGTFEDHCMDASAAVQLLQVVASGILLLVLPLTAIFCLEFWCKLRFLKSVDAEVQEATTSDTAAGSVADDSGSSSSHSSSAADNSSSAGGLDAGQVDAATIAVDIAIPASRRWTACNCLACLVCLFLTILVVAEISAAQRCSCGAVDNSSGTCQLGSESQDVFSTA